MGKAIDIVKRKPRQPEPFQRDKLHRAVYAACVSVRMPSGSAEQVTVSVCDAVVGWLATREVATTRDIRNIATKHLRTYHPDVAYIYEQHRHIM